MFKTKKSFTGIFATSAFTAVLSLLAVDPAVATQIAAEDFSYSDGVLAGNNGGTGWNGTWSGGGSVTNGVFKTEGSPFSFRDLATTINPTVGQSLYVRFNMGADASFNNDFAGLSFYSGSEERLLLGLTFNTDTYGINVTGRANTSSADSVTPLMNYLVGEILFNTATNFTVNLYVNPTGSLLGIADSTYTGDFIGGAWDQVRIASGGSSSTVGSFDNIVIGTQLSDVLATVPEPATWLLMSIGLLVGFSCRQLQSYKYVRRNNS